MEENFDIIKAGEALFDKGNTNRNVSNIFVDRTIWHTVHLEDENGKKLYADGKPLVENRKFITRGSFTTQEILDEALALEAKFHKINKDYRDLADAEKLPWRLNKREVLSLPMPTA